ncbi:predicted DNA helicase (ATP-dependent, RecQ type) [Paracholeplasma brassicae]|uniref:Predicted DNA helicase (ATP-dependent, RecQ type) n=1 Tax=Acholeplasma brassicae TaxID=61635 RepID=U4KTD0_9MOLU|nr:HRDC domain-containing protein [Paracholeplasma brassicae]CCV66474.1 predicted DNA helicase (ATP-dependent, RecQ type) [Paracholeplasma brassicae]
MFIKAGLHGESNVYYELKNARLPFICLHDIRLNYNDLVAQFDFIIIASNFILVIETKNLYGEIVIDNEGNFSRKSNYGQSKYTEGIYSPIVQNRKHLELLNEFLRNNKLIRRCPLYSLVVVANEKTLVDKDKAPKDIKDNIIKHDRLIEYLNKLDKNNTTIRMKHSYMKEIADVIVENHEPLNCDFVAKKFGIEMTKKTNLVEEEEQKYSIESNIFNPPITESNDNLKDTDKTLHNEVKLISETIADDSADVDMAEASSESGSKIERTLKYYRFNKARSLKIKPYFIFNNNELLDLINKLPRTKEEFLSISGFGEKKYELYGVEIIEIINGKLVELEEKLNKYRLDKSRELNVKAYVIFNNQQRTSIMKSLCKNKEELKKTDILSVYQFDKYGNDIANVIIDVMYSR